MCLCVCGLHILGLIKNVQFGEFIEMGSRHQPVRLQTDFIALKGDKDLEVERRHTHTHTVIHDI